MKISPITIVMFVAFGLVGVLIWLSGHPIRTAKAKCEQHIESATGYNLRSQQDFSMHVTGGSSSGKIQIAFLRASELRTAECLLESGAVKRLMLDGKEIPVR